MLWLASALTSLVGTRRIATGRATTAQMRSFSSTSEYEQALAAEATLPSGFQVGTAGFRFSPAEAAEGTRATMNLTLIVADAPSSSWAAVFTKNAFCGAPVTVGRNRLAAGGDLQAIVVNNKISNVCSGSDGVGDSEAVCAAAADALSLPGGASSVLPASTGNLQPRRSRDAAETQPRCSRDAAETQPRCSRDAAEMQPDAAEVDGGGWTADPRPNAGLA